MAFGKRSTISDNLYDYSIMICGESGVGKTTVISELCEKEFGEDGYLLLNTGDEEGVSAIEGVTYEDVPTYILLDSAIHCILSFLSEPTSRTNAQSDVIVCFQI